MADTSSYRGYRTEELERLALAYSRGVGHAKGRDTDLEARQRADLCAIVAELHRRKSEVRENAGEYPADVLKVRGRYLFAAGLVGGEFYGSGL